MSTVTAPDAHAARLRLRASDRARAALVDVRWQMGLALAFACLVRLYMIVRAHGMLDGDEAVLGIQAEDILRGAHPFYFYGQAYMGSWDAYLAAPLVALVGPSAWPLHAVTLAESLLLVPLFGMLAARLYGERAQLPAMLLAALPPLYVTMGEVRMLGGYIETMVLGTALLLLATSLASRWTERRPTRAQWALIGLLTGLALWIDALIVYYLVSMAIWLLPIAVRRLRVAWAERASEWRPALINALVCAALGVVGAAPAVVYGVQHHFVNFGIFGTNQAAVANLASNHKFITDPLRLPVAAYYFLIALPLNFGMLIPWPTAPGTQVLTMVAALLAGTLSLLAISRTLLALVTRTTRTSRREPHPESELPARWRAAFPAIMFAVVSLVFWRSPVTSALLPTGYWTSNARYALPLATAMSLMFASLFAGFSSQTSEAPGLRETPTSPVEPPRWRLGARLKRHMGAIALTLLLTCYCVPYLTTDTVAVMASAYAASLRFPADNQGLLTYLEQHQIRYVWTSHWIGNVTMYLEDQRIQCADYADVVVGGGPNRFPRALALVSSADRPSFIVQDDAEHGKPAAAVALDSLHVTYVMAQFGSLWVITPVSRTVRPAEILPQLTAGN